MTFNIPSEEKRVILENRLKSLNLDGYQYEINKKTAEALGNQELADQAQKAMDDIQATIAVIESELENL